MSSKDKKKINIYAVLDFETDPFIKHRHPEPFACGFYFVDPDGCPIYKDFWGDDCVFQLACYIESLNPKWRFTIYAHNGGKFDFYYLWEANLIGREPMMIGSRIVKCEFMQKHEVRDSYAILPIPLSAWHKDEIDYKKMEREDREKHKAEILAYQKTDCVSLHNLLMRFIDRFGPKLTIASAAMAEIQKYHPVPRRSRNHDEIFRQYYFGGRVQCFEIGALIPSPGRKFKIYDVNSMYPKAMHSFDHPFCQNYLVINSLDAFKMFDPATGILRGIEEKTFINGEWSVKRPPYFMRFIGENRGALPTRVEEGPLKGSLTFNKQYGEFFACSHEIQAACELGLLRVDSIMEIRVATSFGKFDEFINIYAAEKSQSKELQDSDPANRETHKANETFAKLIQNSGYGKYAIDPTKYRNYFFYDNEDPDAQLHFEKWRDEQPGVLPDSDGELTVPDIRCDEDTGRFEVWSAAAPDEQGFYDVAIAASITSAARSILLRAIAAAERPIYCDTDSLICEAMGDGTPIHNSELGAWKFEGESDKAFIVAKKVYCIWNATKNKKTGKLEHKYASKGTKLTPNVIRRLATKKIPFVTWTSDAPNFSPSKPFGQGKTNFVTRRAHAPVDTVKN